MVLKSLLLKNFPQIMVLFIFNINTSHFQSVLRTGRHLIVKGDCQPQR